MNLDYTISHTNTNFKFLFMEIPKKNYMEKYGDVFLSMDILFPYCLDSGTVPLRTATPRPEL